MTDKPDLPADEKPDAGKRIDTNLLWLLAAMGAGFIFLITRLDGVEARLGQKIEKVGDQVSAMSADMAVLKIGQQPVIPPKPKP